MPGPLPARPRPARFWILSRRSRFAYALLLPAVALLIVVVAYPLVSGILLSFQDADFVGSSLVVKGFTFDNFARAIGAPDFVPSLARSLAYVAIVTLGSFAIGLFTAILLNETFRGRAIARMAIALPWAIPLVVATNIWWWLLDPSYGLVNSALAGAGLLRQPIQWTSEPFAAFIAICLVTIWKGYPFFTIMLLAGLQAIPRDLYDASSVDGAGVYRRFRHITLPALGSVASIAVLLNALWVFKEFTVIWVLTGGGPVNATETLAIATYRAAFQDFHFAFAAALGVVTLAISLVGTLVAVRIAGRDFY